MIVADPQALLEAVVDTRRLLDHPFYRRWTRGELTIDELRAYAAQYRHFESHLPTVLTRIVAGADDPAVRDAVAANLADEAGGPITHLALFDRFVDGIGGSPAPATSATAALLETYDAHTAASPTAGIAAVLAYEWQSPAVAQSKADGLREHYGVDGPAVAFWQLHADVDTDHARWLLDALARAGDADPAVVTEAARSVCDAWLAFLDERQAEAPAGSAC